MVNRTTKTAANAAYATRASERFPEAPTVTPKSHEAEPAGGQITRRTRKHDPARTETAARQAQSLD
ncbi:hypothetical protein ONR57_18975 [Hoyosella sp. YIM 151337]|uniref:hypothetical protein n=1 Tax=Hoyosella sp. YIM 151337 TaxID=2992742 RepID=UPI0022365D8C|nr:hypothetical protein [Hoyosella sp. YIM 151337]MCW4355390.1 hypothetical protein [Hoyosella sp. YIM 151337]